VAGSCTAACTHCMDWAASMALANAACVGFTKRHDVQAGTGGALLRRAPDAGSLGWPAYVRFGAWMALSVVVYCCYSVHSADARQHAVLRMQSSGWVPRPLPCAAWWGGAALHIC